MKYEKFEIKNFKGIQSIALDLKGTPQSSIFIFVGLNESGKTTILEALSFFYRNLKDEKEITLQPDVVNDIHDLIPKNKKDNFNDKISIRCTFSLEQQDIEIITKEVLDQGYIIENFNPEISITHSYEFLNSVFQKKSNIWTTPILIKKKGRGQTKSIKIYLSDTVWPVFYQSIYKIMPPILYYPNFLFDFPDKIYLEETENEGKEQTFYRKVLQDILDSLDNDLNLKTHIIDRANSGKNQENDALEIVLNKMGDKITRMVFNNSFSIFGSNARNKQIFVSYPKNNSITNICRIEIKRWSR